MQLRIAIYRDRLTVTAKEVTEYASKHGVSMMSAKRALLNEEAPRLQCLDPVQGWVDVPTVILEKEG
jgi:hypothetical protein